MPSRRGGGWADGRHGPGCRGNWRTGPRDERGGANLPSSRRGLSVAAVGPGLGAIRRRCPGDEAEGAPDMGQRWRVRRSPERSPRRDCGEGRSPSKSLKPLQFQRLHGFRRNPSQVLQQYRRIARLQESRQEGPESAPKGSFVGGREIGFPHPSAACSQTTISLASCQNTAL